MASEQHAAVQASLARNLLSSVLALAFPDDLATNAEEQRDFLAQVSQVSAMFEQHSVFEYVTEGKALDKFQSKLFELVDQAGVLRDVKAAAFELLLVVVEQLPLEQLEQWLPKLIERVTKMVKYIKDGPNVVASACAVARILLRHVEMYSPEARRELFDLLSKLFPALLSVLLELGKPYEEVLSKDEVALFANGLDVFTELLQASPTSVRSSLSKLESAAALVFYNASLATDATARRSAARCLATLANASDKTPQMWKQIVDKTIEMAHLQVELIAGKRMVSSAQTTVLKNWLRDESATADLVTKLSVYKRAEAVCQRLSIAVEVLEECVASRYVCEREVQLVINDVVTLSRRILAVRAHEIGKQSAISEDGFRLPASVVYGVLPQFHQLGLRALQATVERAGLCALRHASKITKTLSLAAENVHPESHAALYQGVAICVRALGASSLERLGQPLIDHMVVQCKEDLEADETKSKKALEADAKAQVENKSGKTGKGKKRKRQIGDVSQLSADAAGPGALFMSARNQRLLVGNVDAALNAIATCVAVYGSLLPMESRSLASEVALLAAQQQLKRQAFLAVPLTNAGLSPVAMLLLTDAVSADANGAHATNVVPSVQYLSGLPSSSLLQRLTLNATEALLHPRGPPLTINVDSAVPTAPVMNGSTYGSSVNNHSVKSVRLPGAANVRGNLDWEKEDATMTSNEPETEDNASTKRTKVENGSKSADVDMQAAGNDVEEEEEEEEEDYDDERPVATEAEVEVQEEREEPAVQRTTAAVSTLAVDEDDDDEFPDIVVDDADDE